MQGLCKLSQLLSITGRRKRVGDHMPKDNQEEWNICTREITCFWLGIGESRTPGWQLPETRVRFMSGPGLGTRNTSLIVKTLPTQTGKLWVAPYGFEVFNRYEKVGYFPNHFLAYPSMQTQLKLDKNEKVHGTHTELNVVPYPTTAN